MTHSIGEKTEEREVSIIPDDTQLVSGSPRIMNLSSPVLEFVFLSIKLNFLKLVLACWGHLHHYHRHLSCLSNHSLPPISYKLNLRCISPVFPG